MTSAPSPETTRASRDPLWALFLGYPRRGRLNADRRCPRGPDRGTAAVAGAVGLGYYMVLLVQTGLLIAGHRRWLGVSIALLAIHTAVTYCSFYGVFIVLMVIHPGGILCSYPPISLGILLTCTAVLLGVNRQPIQLTEDDDRFLCRCGYDLTGIAPGVCPECGRAESPTGH